MEKLNQVHQLVKSEVFTTYDKYFRSRGDTMIYDSHAHYDDSRFDEDRDTLIKSMEQEGIGRIMNASSDLASSVAILKLCDTYEYMYGAVGVHPHDVKEMHERDLETIIGLAAHDKIRSIGEIGLDYYYDKAPREIQKLWFREQIKLAISLELPIIVHSRDAIQDTYDILVETEASKVGGVIHCFSSSKEMAQKFLDLGFYIGIGGVVTFKNAKEIKSVVESLPMDRLVIETDAPYLTPEPNRGKRNDSRQLKHVIKAIAEIKGISEDDVEEQTYANAMMLFHN